MSMFFDLPKWKGLYKTKVLYLDLHFIINKQILAKVVNIAQSYSSRFS